MKILFITELTHSGGVDTFISSLLKNWPNKEDDLHLITNTRHPGLSGLKSCLMGYANVESHGIRLYVDYLLDHDFHLSCFVSPFLRLFYAVISFFGFFRLFWTLSPDRVVIVAGGYPGGDSCRVAALVWSIVRTGRPMALYNFHNLAVPALWWQIYERGIDWLLSRSVKQFIGVSAACSNSMRVRKTIWRNCRVNFILNGVAPPVAPILTRGKIHQEFGMPVNCPLVSMLATYEPRKGHLMLLNAFVQVLKVLPSARLIICGDGYPDQVEQVRQYISKLGLSHAVCLTGFRRDAYQIMGESDVVAIPTQSYESFGLVAVEAMSMGVPVVATNIGGLPEVVKSGHGGYIVDVLDAAGFAECLIKLLSNSTLRESQGRMGKERALDLFAIKRMAADYSRLIRE